MKVTKEELISILRENGYKVTPQRLAICDFILASENHPTADQIHSAVTKANPTISMNTIYQTLDVLAKLGFLQEMKFSGSSSRFDPNTLVHINIICQKCEKIWDYQSDGVRERWKQIVKEIGKPAVGQRLDLYIICEDCK